uniref:Aldose 1-epimerase n=1 Tax=Polytomella parva TaxID=51329 RepID=A0A7S0YNI9_9CHLO|nr:aldose-1-epimerase (GALC) [Polytomella parva]|mmetsp:Transcript_34633/g.62381  ORF Transcript_34633/g.62381 Transcript_34633/m.62381 type:complete len:398 (+) Transcript_34633:61-1254(+)
MGIDENFIKVGAALLGVSLFMLLKNKGQEKKDKKHVVDESQEEYPIFVLKNKLGVEVHITTIGASITKLFVPSKDGKKIDVVLGYDKTSEYMTADPCYYFGAIVGRVANRIANATFKLDGIDYQLAANNGPNALHGGPLGFHRRKWTVNKQWSCRKFDAIELEYYSPHMEEGYPGNLIVTVTYKLETHDLALSCNIRARTDSATPVNIVQHSYFNLSGHNSGSTIHNHKLLLNAEHYTPTDNSQVPTGEIRKVRGTPLDFTTLESIGSRIHKVPGPDPGGYDHNYVLFGAGEEAANLTVQGKASAEPRLAATLLDPKSGLAMDVLTTAPGLQFYSGNFLGGDKGKDGAHYRRHSGLCLETQAFPNAINQPKFPSVKLTPEEQYEHDVIYRFYHTAAK